MALPLRALNTGETLDRTFSIYRNNFVLFAGIAALAQLCTLCAQLVPAAIVSVIPFASSKSALSFGIVSFSSFILAFIVTLLAYGYSHAATLMAVAGLYLDRPVSVREAYRQVKGRVASVLGTSFIVGIVSGLGLILFVVPGVLLWLRYALAVPVAALEDASPGKAMDRSKHLTEGRRGDIFVIYFLFLVLSWVIAVVLTFPVTLLALAHAKAGIPLWLQVLQHLSGFLAGTLVAPFVTIAMAVVYYDQRVRKEAFDLQMMMSALDRQPLPAAAQAANGA